MTALATLGAPAAVRAVESSPPDYVRMAEEICKNAVREKLWKNREFTTYEFRYAARRTDCKAGLAREYRHEIVDFLPHFLKLRPEIHTDDLSTLPRFIKECAVCFAYIFALDNRDPAALHLDDDKDKVWLLRDEVGGVAARIEELQCDLDEAQSSYDQLVREVEALEEAEAQEGGVR